MKKILHGIFIAILAVTITGCGKSLRSVYNVDKHAMPLKAKKLSDKQRGNRISSAVSRRGWNCQETTTQKLNCIVKSRSHVAHVYVDHNKDYFSINYLDSSNLRYKKGKVHRKYNKWIRTLENMIAVEMSR